MLAGLEGERLEGGGALGDHSGSLVGRVQLAGGVLVEDGASGHARCLLWAGGVAARLSGQLVVLVLTSCTLVGLEDDHAVGGRADADHDLERFLAKTEGAMNDLDDHPAIQRLEGGVSTEHRQLLVAGQAGPGLVVGPQHAVACLLQGPHHPAGPEFAWSGQGGAFSNGGWEVAGTQLSDTTVDQHFARPSPYPPSWIHPQERGNRIRRTGPASVADALDDLAALHVGAEDQAAGLAGAGIAAVHWPAVWPLGARGDDGTEPGSADHQPLGDELLDGTGGGLIADAVPCAEFRGAGQPVAAGIVGSGLVLSFAYSVA